jgi:hypothetical protein
MGDIQGELRGKVGRGRGGKEIDGCPLTTLRISISEVLQSSELPLPWVNRIS